MPQLTGNQTSTNQSDLFTGEIQIVDLTAATTNAGILGATIDGLNGNDTIKGVATLKPTAVTSVTSQGIANSTITDSGIDDDVFLGTGNSEGFTGQGTATGYGLYRGSLNGGAGNDAFTFTGNSQAAQTMKGIGIGFATLDGGAFNDKMLFLGSATGGGASGDFLATAYGAQGANVRGGSEQDTIEASAIAQATSGNGSAGAVAIAAKGSWLLGNEGNDTLRVTANSQGSEANAKGASAALLDGGSGGDSISLLATSNGNRSSGGIAIAAGMDDGAVVNGGDSEDVINVRAEANFGGVSGGRAVAYGIKESSVVAGNDRDALFVSATSSASSNANSYGMYGSKNTSTGQGDDRLIISATASSQGTATAYGLYESDLFSGEGNDQMVITSTSTSASGSGGVGAFKSRIVAGAGNDSIQVAAKERAEFDIKDSIIFGEDGDDTIDVGIGSGKLIGGAGNDLAILNYFNADTMDIALINGLIRVSGTQTKSGTQQDWTQDIFQVERFQVGNAVYSADTLAATFTA